MSIYKDQIAEFVYEQKKMLEQYTRDLNKCLDGNLAYCQNGEKKIYYHTYKENERYRRETIGNDSDMIKSLARREYLSLSIKALENN